MTNFTAIVLGAVEGATEFIPVSSSGHLILVRSLLGINDSFGLSFDAVLQLSATFAMIIYFRKDVWNLFLTFVGIITRKNTRDEDRTLFYSIVIGTIPAVIFGLLLENWMDTIFRNVLLVSITLILGSFLFWIAQKLAKQNKQISVGRGIIIGLFQCLALVPGVSRSGATISGGLISGLKQDEAVRFSFILSIPILLGSGLKKLFEVRNDLFSSSFGAQLFVGSFVAFVVGFLSIRFLIKYLKNHNLDLFIWYRVGLALLILAVTFF